MSIEAINYKKFFYPPGGILIWVIILVEVVTFSAGIIALAWLDSLSPELFATSRQSLHQGIGFTNTFILLTSGLFVAQAVHYLKKGNNVKSQQLMWLSILSGTGFLALKSYEYILCIGQGFDLTYNDFFTFYWLLTGFHFLHVLTGLVILVVLTWKIKNGTYHALNILDVESGASFWHMCDIIWLLLFPVLYLL